MKKARLYQNLQRGTHFRKGHIKPDALSEQYRECFKISNSVVRCHRQFPWSIFRPYLQEGWGWWWWYCHQVVNWTLQASGEGWILDMPVHEVLHLSVVTTWPISMYNSVSSRIYWICMQLCVRCWWFLHELAAQLCINNKCAHGIARSITTIDTKQNTWNLNS